MRPLTIKVYYRRQDILDVYYSTDEMPTMIKSIRQGVAIFVFLLSVCLYFRHKANTDHATGYVVGFILLSIILLIYTLRLCYHLLKYLQRRKSIAAFAKREDGKIDVVECTSAAVAVTMEKETIIVPWQQISFAHLADNYILLASNGKELFIPAASVTTDEFNALQEMIREQVVKPNVEGER